MGPNGSSANKGSLNSPWSLITVWTDHGVPRAIKPGDTICLRGGTYVGGYHVQLQGTPTAQITTQPYPGERATIDGTGISVDGGGYVTIRGLEVTYSNLNRTDYRAGGFAVSVPGVKLINNIIHDTGAAIVSNETGFDDEFYGNVIYNIGWDDTNSGLGQGGTGPAFYCSNQTGFKRFYENIVTNGFGVGFHLYSAGRAHLNNFDLQGNVSFDNGYWTRVQDSSYASEGRTTDNFLIGNRPITNLVFKDNFGYHREQRGGMNVNIGYGMADNVSGVIQGNTMVGGTNSIARFSTVNFRRNFVASHWTEMYYAPPSASSPIVSQVIDGNVYYFYPDDCGSEQFNAPDGVAKTIAQWRAMGLDANSSFYPCGTRPTNSVTVRKNAYDANRAHVIIGNFLKLAMVTADLSSVLKVGDQFEFHNSQDYYGPLVASGTYSGPISINMVTLAVARPVGWNGAMVKSSGPEFAAFILIKK